MAKDTDRLKLTNSSVAELPTPKKGRVAYYDTAQRGLCAVVSASGSRSFYWVGRAAGRPTRICLGQFPAMGAMAARNEAARISGEVSDGKIPTARRKQAASQLTLGVVFDDWHKNYSRPHKRTWQTDERRFRRVFSDWRHRPLSGITTSEVQQRHLMLEQKSGKYAANKMLELFRSLVKYAEQSMGWDGRDPSRSIKRFAVQSRERFLTADELSRFFAAVNKLQRPVARDFIMLALFTGARRSNVQAMRWDEIDFGNQLWTIVATKSKSKKTMVLPLSNAAMDILRRRRETSHGPWVLPGHGKHGHYSWPKAAWERVTAISGISDLRIHDLRRTLGSFQAMTGASLITIAKSLGHTNLSSTQIYARLQVSETRAAVESAIAKILSAAQENPEDQKKQ